MEKEEKKKRVLIGIIVVILLCVLFSKPFGKFVIKPIVCGSKESFCVDDVREKIPTE